MSDVIQELTAIEQLEVLRIKNRELLRKLDHRDRNLSDMLAALYKGAYDGIINRGLLPKVPKPKRDTRTKVAEIAQVNFSDLQLAKVTPDYNTPVAAERVNRYADKVIHLTEIQRADHPIRECHVNLIGDIIEGELIFPGQSWKIDASLYRQVTIDGPDILEAFLRKLLANYDKVHVNGVIGNHGRIGGRSSRDMSPESNADMFLYNIVRRSMANETRLTWTLPDLKNERAWYAIDRIGQFGFLLFHGDQLRGGFAGIPLYAMGRAINQWAAGAIREPWDYAICGHWHTPTMLTFSFRTVYVNGTFESYNTYAQETIKAMGQPQQLLLFVHPDKGITAEYWVKLDK